VVGAILVGNADEAHMAMFDHMSPVEDSFDMALGHATRPVGSRFYNARITDTRSPRR